MDVKDDLRFICSEVTALLRYAEGKHGVFLAFNGVSLFHCIGLLRLISPGDGIFQAKSMLFVTMGLLMCAMATSMYSFLPQILDHNENTAPEGKNDLLFFEHIKEHTVESYIQTLCRDYGVSACNVTAFERSLISQTIINARLASRKFRLFKNAAYLDLVAAIVGLGGFVLRSMTV